MSLSIKNFIDELKSRNDIVEIARELIPGLKRLGRLWVGTTRNEKTSALTIYSDTKSWTHFAGDTTPRGKNGGDVIDLVEYVRKCNPREAMQFLADRVGIELRPLTAEEQLRIETERKRRDDDAAILERLVAIFEQNRDTAAAYLQGRGISREVVEKYRIGWADHTTDHLRKELQGFNQELVTTALSNFSFFKNSLIIPIIERGRAVSLYSRSDERDAKHMYLPGRLKGIFNYDEAMLHCDGLLYLAEAPIDALSAIQHSIKSIVSFGSCNPSTEQKAWLGTLRNIDMVCCFDNDADQANNRGYEATKAFLQEFPQAKMKRLPPGDINDYFRANTSADFEGLETQELHEILLEELDPNTPKERLAVVLKPLFTALAKNVDFATTQLFLRHRVKTYFNATARDIEALLASFKEVRDMVRERVEAEAKKQQEEEKEKVLAMTDEERAEAEAFLRDPGLIDVIRDDITKIGVVGENNNKTALYLMCATRKMKRPINCTVRAGSSVGKSNLTSKVLDLMPEEDVIRFTRITSKFLDYLGENDLQHKILYIAERAGTEDADYSLRMVEDDTNPGIELGYVKKNAATGEMTAVKKVVRGPTMVIQTTTKLETNEENESREFPIYLDDGEEQRADVHEFIKRSKLPHIVIQNEERDQIVHKHRNAQRLLRNVAVAIPFSQLVEFPTKRARSNRDLNRFLKFIEVSAFVQQLQRPRIAIRGKEYLLATLRDYETAYNLLGSILEDAMADFNPASEKLFQAAKKIQSEKVDETRFTRADLAKALGWEKTKELISTYHKSTVG